MAHFTDGKKPGDVLATADYRVYGTGHRGEAIDTTVHAELTMSGAFAYGNRTCMVLVWKGNPMEESYDTRYENVTPDSFRNYVLDFLTGRIKSTLTVEAI